jgi:hypothetical protein
MWRSSVRRWAGSCGNRRSWRRIYSLAGMLVYLGFRFEWIYGVAAVVTVFHDTLITVGAFSLTNGYLADRDRRDPDVDWLL